MKQDKFKTKYEFFIILLIWAIYHNLTHAYVIFVLDNNKYVLFTIYFFQNLSFMCLYSFLIYTRMKIDPNEFLQTLRNFDLFMRNHLCFSFFKEYLKNNHDEYLYYIAFWVDYYIFKELCSNYIASGCDNSRGQLEYIKITCNSIFEEYFLPLNLSINSASKLGGSIIEFPTDIQDNVKELAIKNFEVDFRILKNSIDEAFLFVNNKLYCLYVTMSKNEKEYAKIEKMISFLDINEVKKQIDLGRKTTLETQYTI